MKYTCEININLPRDRIFENQENLFQWQEGLESFDHLSGQAGRVGGKSKLTYNYRGKKFEMVETITAWNPPEEKTVTCESDGTWNEVKNLFHPIDEKSMRLTCTSEFRVKGLFGIVALLFPGMFKKQTLQYMRDFKNFAERH